MCEGTTYISHRVDVNVILRVGGVRHKWFDKELPEHTRNVLDLLFLSGSCCDPFSGFWPGLVQGQETSLASSLDQLIWLGNQFHAWCLEPGKCALDLVEDGIDVLIFWEVDRGELGWRVVYAGRLQRSWLDHWGTGEVVVEDGLAISFEDRFGRHIVVWSGETVVMEGKRRFVGELLTG